MSVEIKYLVERRMLASKVRWNMIEEPGGGKLLANDTKYCPEKRFYRLTPRQFEILDLIVSGASNGIKLAYSLGICHRTLINHKTDIFRVFGIPDRRQNTTVFLIGQLVSDGILSFVPSIPEERWVGIRKQ